LLEKFAGYGFNKSHAAAYAIVAYQTAYLKANYPVEFPLCNDDERHERYSQAQSDINEARVMGIEVLAPDVKRERRYFFAPAPFRGQRRIKALVLARRRKPQTLAIRPPLSVLVLAANKGRRRSGG